MRIVHISLYPARDERHINISGVASYTKDLVTSLPAQTGDEIWVLAQRIPGTPERYEENSIQIVRCFDRGLRFAGKILRELKTLKPDVIHIQQELALYGGILTAVLLRSLVKKAARLAPVALTLHGVVSRKSITPSFVKENNSHIPVPLVRMAFAFIFRPLCRHATHIIVHEKVFKDILVEEYRAGEAHVSVIHHGIEEHTPLEREKAREHLRLPCGQKAHIILYMGYLTGYKGIDLLIDGFKEYIKRDASALLIIGAGPHPKLRDNPSYKREYARLETRAREELGAHMLWHGFIGEKDIPYWFSASDLAIFPYTVSMSSSGPMALALAYGRPFIASKVFAPVFDEECLLFEREPGALADRIEDFFAHPERYYQVAENLRRARLWTNVGKTSYALYALLHKDESRV
jgi:glycosyltransferase involved in cell wall biosynthesis